MNIQGIVDLVFAMQEGWLAREMSKRMPADLFLRAYGNTRCKADVAEWLEKEGYGLAVFPDGKKELRRFDEVLSTFDPIQPKIRWSCLYDPLHFGVPFR